MILGCGVRMQTAQCHGGAMTTMFHGSLACIGLGVIVEAHLTPATRRLIARSDVLFVANADSATILALNKLHKDLRLLRRDHTEHCAALEIDDAIVESVLDEVRRGRHVTVAFLGHPNRASRSARVLIRAAQQEGWHAIFEPAISVEDCLFADVGIDISRYGCQHYDVLQIMKYRRSIDTSAYLLLWRFGEKELRSKPRRELLLEVLAREYPLDHQMFSYIPAMFDAPFSFMRWVVGSLPSIEAHPLMAIIIPPATDLLPDKLIDARLSLLE